MHPGPCEDWDNNGELMRAVLLVPLLCTGLSAAADPGIERGFEHFYNLEYDQSIVEFEKAVAQDPFDPNRHNHLAQALLYREMYRVGALESELVSGTNPFLRRAKMNPGPEVERRFFGEIQKSMDLCQVRLRRNVNDTAALYSLGVAHGLRANYNFLVRKAWLDSLRDATTGRKLHNRVTELEPSNYDSRLMQGIHDYIVGSLPVFYRMLGIVVGFRGDKTTGIGTLQQVGERGNLNRFDAQILLCALYRRENQPRLALPLLEKLLLRYPRNYLLLFEQAQMYSLIGDQAQAIASIQKVADQKRRAVPGFVSVPWEKVYFHLGTIQFWYRDLEASLENMKRVTASPSEVDLNTGVMAFLRQGQIYDMTNRRELAIRAYRQAIDFAPQAEAAQESRRYLASPYRRGKKG